MEAEVESGSLPQLLPILGIEVVSHLISELTDLTGLFSVLMDIPSVCLFSSGITCEPTQPGNQRSDGWWGSELQSSHIHGKHFIHQPISPGPI